MAMRGMLTEMKRWPQYSSRGTAIVVLGIGSESQVSLSNEIVLPGTLEVTGITTLANDGSDTSIGKEWLRPGVAQLLRPEIHYWSESTALSAQWYPVVTLEDEPPVIAISIFL